MDYQKEFIKKFNEISAECSRYTIWSAFVVMCACAIRNSTPMEGKEQYEAEYLKWVKQIQEADKIAELFALTVLALDKDPDQDFLGEVFMKLNLNDNKLGQVFTPYHVSKLMAKITCVKQEYKPWVTICDPCVGTGTMLIATANVNKELGINYQTDILFCGQDIDRIIGLTAYVQLSLLGCAGYIIVGNSLTSSISGSMLNPIISSDSEIWYTPMYFRDIWQCRN